MGPQKRRYSGDRESSPIPLPFRQNGHGMYPCGFKHPASPEIRQTQQSAIFQQLAAKGSRSGIRHPPVGTTNASRPPVSGHPDPHRRTRTSNPCGKNNRKPTEKTSDGQQLLVPFSPTKGDSRLPGQSLRPPSPLKGPAARRHPQTCPGCPRTAGGPGNPPFLRQLAMHSENGRRGDRQSLRTNIHPVNITHKMARDQMTCRIPARIAFWAASSRSIPW